MHKIKKIKDQNKEYKDYLRMGNGQSFYQKLDKIKGITCLEKLIKSTFKIIKSDDKGILWAKIKRKFRNIYFHIFWGKSFLKTDCLL